MKIVIFSSVFNHHSLPLCDALNALPEVECTFVETMEEEQQRKDLGYHSYNRQYVLNMLESAGNHKKAHQLALTADVMIASVFPYEFLKERLQENKLTFLCQERIFKGGAGLMRRARAWFYNLRKFYRFRKKPLYFLSLGEGAAQDYHSIGFYKGKSFRWAYYPPFLPYDTEALMKKKNGEKIRILFVGRMICWKNPNFVLRGVKSLLAAGYAVELTYIGNGPLLETLKNEAADVRDAVHFLGAMSPEQVRNHMEMSNILTFTSNSMEGWGAVLNEAMNAGCAVVTSASPGSAQTLLRDGENGLVYQGDSYEAFYQKLLQLVESPELTRKLGVAAYRTIADQYNAAVAAQRFCEQCKALLNEERIQDYAAGPMTRV